MQCICFGSTTHAVTTHHQHSLQHNTKSDKPLWLYCVQVDNLYTTSSLAWKPDGSRVAVGGLTGSLALYDACLRRSRCG